jgi:23S rRNA (uracil1939-C5)-methyltransferase
LLTLYQSLDLQFDGLRRLSLQIGSDDHPMLILTMVDDNAPELLTELPASINMLLSDNEPVNLIGESHSRFVVRERDFRVTAGSYFRPNIAQIPALVDLVLEALAGAKSVLDLYGGVGTLSAFVAPQADIVTLVESYPPAVTDADVNLSEFDNVDLIEGRVEDLLAELEAGYEAAILDPPSEGLSVEVVDALAELAIPRLIYISSDPATLARDAKRLLRQGYTLGLVQALDFAPQTYYIDSLAIFNR